MSFYEILQVRTAIFVVRTKCIAYLEVDGKDKLAYHLFQKENEKIIAYLRVLPKGISYQEASLGRIIVKQATARYRSRKRTSSKRN